MLGRRKMLLQGATWRKSSPSSPPLPVLGPKCIIITTMLIFDVLEQDPT